MKYEKIKVNPVTARVGAEIEGVDLAKPMDDRTFEEVHHALTEHCVIFFRGQDLDHESHKAFGRRFGELHVHPLKHEKNQSGTNNGIPANQRVERDPAAERGGSDPAILEIRATQGSKYVAGGAWHDRARQRGD